MRTAIEDDDPVVIFEASALDSVIGEIVDDYRVPLGRATVLRTGKAASVVTLGAARPKVLRAADTLAAGGISVDVIDLRSIVPMDRAAVRTSVASTGRVVIVDEGPPTCSVATEVITAVVEDAATFAALRSPPVRVTAASVPVPFARGLEDEVLPSVRRIVNAVHGVCSA
jgi:pyruvate dehydrogenase E1 component beta subunit